MLGMNPYQSMMGMPGMQGYGSFPQQSGLGLGLQAGLGLGLNGLGMPGSSMMGMPGMQGYGNPMMNNPAMMSPYTQSPYGYPTMGGQQQPMLGGYPSMMGRK
uniref:Uncharacterized protein n=1 Tax=Panagrolaimus sp. ES5 TaxID=591445 RepID=A0AC34FHQ5_9BILA